MSFSLFHYFRISTFLLLLFRSLFPYFPGLLNYTGEGGREGRKEGGREGGKEGGKEGGRDRARA